MKRLLLSPALIFAFLFILSGLKSVHAANEDSTLSSSRSVLVRGAHDQWVQSIREVPGPDGQSTSVTNFYVEFAVGLNVWNGNEWVEAKPEFRIENGFVIADQVQQKVRIANNLNVEGAVLMQDVQGREFRSTPAILALRDVATGQAATIAVLKDVVGQQATADSIVFLDAFEGIKASVRYTVRRDGTEQDILLEEPIDPADWNLPPTAQLECWTETYGWAEAKNIEATKAGELDDLTLDFDHFKIGAGKAFAFGFEHEKEIPIAKRYGQVGQRRFLVEMVQMKEIKPLLDALPQEARVQRKSRQPNLELKNSEEGLLAEFKPRSRATPVKQGDLMASISGDKMPKAVLLDYSTVGTVSTYTFSGSTTYYISGASTVSGLATFEGGTILKYDSAASASLSCGTVQFRTTPYRPVIFTSKLDSSCGEFVASGTPSQNNYGTPALKLTGAGTHKIHDVAFRYAAEALRVANGSLTVTNIQMVNCAKGFYQESTAGVLEVRNLLAHNVAILLDGTSTAAIRGYHWTTDNVTTFMQGTVPAAELRNSLLVATTGTAGKYTDPDTSVALVASATGVFAPTVGAGAHYLAANSPYRNVGKPLTDTQFAAEIRSRTTYAPQVMSGSLASGVVLSSVTPGDTGNPDYGYHYAKVDVVLNGVQVSGNVTLTNGVVVMLSGANGLKVNGAYILDSWGRAEAMNRLLWYSGVHEQPTLVGAAVASRSLIEMGTSGAPLPSCNLRFTEFNLMAGEGRSIHLIDAQGTGGVVLQAKDCRFHNGQQYFSPGVLGVYASVVNNLFENVQAGFYQNTGYSTQPMTLSFRNNLFRNGALTFSKASVSTTWTIKANLFDVAVSGSVANGATLVTTHNGYRLGATRLPGETNYKEVTTFNYLSGPYGDYYYDTTGAATTLAGLVNSGDQTVDLAGLYHHTVSGSTLAKDSGTVDIGFHWVASSSAGVPLNGDGDLAGADYWEDTNGDGFAGSGESSWLVSSSGLPVAPSLLTFTPLK